MHKKNIVHRDLKPENLLFKDKSEESPLMVKKKKKINRKKSIKYIAFTKLIIYIYCLVIQYIGH